MYGSHISNEYIKGVDAFIDFAKKTCWTAIEEIFVVHANIARMRRDITQMMC
jgi:hypothetical protein